MLKRKPEKKIRRPLDWEILVFEQDPERKLPGAVPSQLTATAQDYANVHLILSNPFTQGGRTLWLFLSTRRRWHVSWTIPPHRLYKRQFPSIAQRIGSAAKKIPQNVLPGEG